jgi:hypothetical protein
MIPVRAAQEKNTRNAADSTKRRHCGAHRRVTMALSVLAYNLTRVMNIVGIKPLMAAIVA